MRTGFNPIPFAVKPVKFAGATEPAVVRDQTMEQQVYTDFARVIFDRKNRYEQFLNKDTWFSTIPFTDEESGMKGQIWWSFGHGDRPHIGITHRRDEDGTTWKELPQTEKVRIAVNFTSQGVGNVVDGEYLPHFSQAEADIVKAGHRAILKVLESWNK